MALPATDPSGNRRAWFFGAETLRGRPPATVSERVGSACRVDIFTVYNPGAQGAPEVTGADAWL